MSEPRDKVLVAMAQAIGNVQGVGEKPPAWIDEAKAALDAALDVLQGESESDIMDFIDALRAGKGSE